jgi:lysylphosphatidylglycerol synthetase-like protein (DUF2156 family)
MTAVRERGVASASGAHRVRVAFLTRAPRVISSVAVVLGLMLIAELLVPHRWRAAPLAAAFVPEPARATAEAVVLVSGWLLLRIARGLRKRKRTEWRVAIAVCVAVIAADLLRSERRPVEAVLTTSLLIALVLARSQYTAAADPRGRAFALRIAGQFLTLAIGYGMVLLYLPGHVGGSVSTWLRLREVLTSLIGLGGWIPIRSDHYADLFHATLLISRGCGPSNRGRRCLRQTKADYGICYRPRAPATHSATLPCAVTNPSSGRHLVRRRSPIAS